MLRPVGLEWGDVGLPAVSGGELGEELGGDGGGGSVGAIDDEGEVGEGEIGDGGQEEADVLGAVAVVDGGGDGGFGSGEACGDRGRFELAEDLGFDGELGGVGELEAVGAEELDAVVLPGIVGGGDDDARGEFVELGEVGDGGGGDDAGVFDGGSAGVETGGEGGGDPGGGLAGVHAEEDFGA